MLIYIDESGDTGWKFDKPFMQGGSSRYLTISALVIPSSKKDLSKRIIRKMYTRHGWDTVNEKKATDMNPTEKLHFCSRAVKLMTDNDELSIYAITVKKENVLDHIRRDSNKLYNYMLRLALLDEMARHPVVTIIPDERSIKVKSGNSLVDYLQIGLWFEKNAPTQLHCIPGLSHKVLNLQFIDTITHCIWRRYEFNDSSFYRILKPHILEKVLFF